MKKRRHSYEEVQILTLYKTYKLQMELNLSQLKLLEESKKYVTNLIDKKKMATIENEMKELVNYQNKVMKLYEELAAVLYKFTFTGTSTPTFRIVLVEYLIKDKSVEYITKKYGLTKSTIYENATRIKKELMKINVNPNRLV